MGCVMACLRKVKKGDTYHVHDGPHDVVNELLVLQELPKQVEPVLGGA
jgi:hypothetical protein